MYLANELEGLEGCIWRMSWKDISGGRLGSMGGTDEWMEGLIKCFFSFWIIWLC